MIDMNQHHQHVTAPKKGAIESDVSDKPELDKGQTIERPADGERKAYDVEYGGDKRRVYATNDLEARALYNDARQTWPAAKTVKVVEVDVAAEKAAKAEAAKANK